MATEPPSPLRLEAPGPPDVRTPPASEADSESAPKPAGGTLRFLNGCVPLSHQVAGHMYGKDKVGKWGLREPGAGLDAPLVRARASSALPRSLAPRAARGPEKWG